MTATIHHGDCLDVLRQMPDNSVHAIVTDPPYGLSNTTPEQVADTIVKWVSGDREYLPSGKGFMGKEWDGFVPPVAVWDEAMRVLKPGGHVLAFAGSRTHDLMTLGLRLAGFDIRDSVYWHYGSGMPKSHDIGKAIDKARRDDSAWRTVGKWLKARRESAGYATRAEFAPLILDGHKNLESAAANLSNWENGLSFPTWERWLSLKSILSLPADMDAEVWRLNGRKGTPGEAWAQREVTGTGTSGKTYGMGGLRGVETSTGAFDITAPATDAARKWSGWGTALKPATEPIVLARKPFPGTVAANVLEHGTGGLNIDACRVASNGDHKRPFQPTNNTLDVYGAQSGFQPTNAEGRWPANVILDEHMAGVLDEQSGVTVSKRASRGQDGRDARQTYRRALASAENDNTRGHNDSGGASRFFYVAEQDTPFMYAPKAPKKERPDVDGVKHPTVKPVSIMSWLVRLVTPPNGIVLDPFAGSGATIEAAMLEGFQVIGIEREAEYLPLIHHRIERAQERIKTEQQQQAEAPDQGAFPLEDIA